MLLRNSLQFNLAQFLVLSFSVSVLCYFGQYLSRAFTYGFVLCTMSANCKEMRPLVVAGMRLNFENPFFHSCTWTS